MSFFMEQNGRRVSSNKSGGVRFSGQRIIFSDGSWCDLKTGEVIVIGRGYIELDGKRYDKNSGGSVNLDKATDDDRVVTHDFGVFDATSLDLQLSAADARVSIHDGPGIRLKVTAMASQIEMITHTLRGGVLFVNDGSTHSGSSIVMTGGGGRGMLDMLRSILSGGVSISGNFGGESQTRIEISVPKGTPVDMVSGGSGCTTIGDIEAQLTALVTGSGDLTVGRVTDASVQTRSSGDISVESINGDAELQTTGSGDITVRGGVIGKLKVTVKASGDVSVEIACQSAHLTTSGSGDIEVDRIVRGLTAYSWASGEIYIGYAGGDVTAQASGSGDIVIRSGAIGALDASCRASGSIDVSATAQTAELTTTGSGDIDVDRVVQPPIKHSRASGDINVHRVG